MEANSDIPQWDSRESASGIFTLLDKPEVLIQDHHKLGYPYLKTTLYIGDVVLSQRMAIEIKRVSKTSNDLKASFFDHAEREDDQGCRLYTQAKQMKDAYDWCGLIIQIEPGATMFDTKYFTLEKWNSIRLSLEVEYNKHIFLTKNDLETLDLIYRLWEKELVGPRHADPTNKAKRERTLADQQKYFISGFLDLGKEKTTLLLQEFKTPYNVIRWVLSAYLDEEKEIIETVSKEMKGFGFKFFQKNKKLLLGVN